MSTGEKLFLMLFLIALGAHFSPNNPVPYFTVFLYSIFGAGFIWSGHKDHKDNDDV